MDYQDEEEGNEREAGGDLPPLPRIKLDTLDRIRREMGYVYREAKFGRRSSQDASRLANILALMARIIEGGQLEQRIEQLEKALAEATPR